MIVIAGKEENKNKLGDVVQEVYINFANNITLLFHLIN